jgi:Gas vesicle synthesis protein GvpL/GvpF
MTVEGKYLYCVTEAAGERLGNIGIAGKEVTGVTYRDVTAIVSSVPFKTIDAGLETIMVHQKVVEACRARATTLPVRFGVIFKDQGGVKEMLEKSYADYRTKLSKLRGKEEFGAKVILDEAGLKRVRAEVETESEEARKLSRAVAKASKGTSYLLKIKLDEAVRNEVAKRIEAMSQAVHDELSRAALESALLKAEHEQIILNAAYLVDNSRREDFQVEAGKVKRKYEMQGLDIHLSGPWAPYSFC